MKCIVYKGSRNADTYLYVPKEHDLSRVPKPLIDKLGKLEQVMELELTPERKLARENTKIVIENLQTNGYFVQLPPSIKDQFMKV
jgi:uncharacterized protein YcgL (UPF0745 family)